MLNQKLFKKNIYLYYFSRTILICTLIFPYIFSYAENNVITSEIVPEYEIYNPQTFQNSLYSDMKITLYFLILLLIIFVYIYLQLSNAIKKNRT